MGRLRGCILWSLIQSRRCFPSSRGSSWACWLLQYLCFLQRAVMAPQAAQAPALCLSFPLLPVVLSAVTHGCCSCPCHLSSQEQK